MGYEERIELTMTNEPKCADLVVHQKESRLNDLRELYKSWCDGVPYHEELEDSLKSYGLCYDYVEPNTWDDQPEGFWRYQISWGGPSDEFRFHDDGRIEYRYMDWYDGAGRDLMSEEYSFMETLNKEFLRPHYTKE